MPRVLEHRSAGAWLFSSLLRLSRHGAVLLPTRSSRHTDFVSKVVRCGFASFCFNEEARKVKGVTVYECK